MRKMGLIKLFLQGEGVNACDNEASKLGWWNEKKRGLEIPHGS